MDERIFQAAFAAFIAAVVGIFLLKFFLIDPRRVRRRLSELMAMGFSPVAGNDPDMNARVFVLLPFLPRSSSVTIKQAVVSVLPRCARYVCDVVAETQVGTKKSFSAYTVVAETRQVRTSGILDIRRRLFRPVEWLFRHLKKSGPELKEGLDPDFFGKFAVFSIAGGEFFLPAGLEAVLLECAAAFPFNRTSGQISICRVSPAGWSICCGRILDRGRMEALLRTADRIGAVL